jgi:hypothetical protein
LHQARNHTQAFSKSALSLKLGESEWHQSFQPLPRSNAASMEVVVNAHAVRTTTSEQKHLDIITVSKRKLTTSKQKPTSATIAANIEEVVVVTM